MKYLIIKNMLLNVGSMKKQQLLAPRQMQQES